MGVKIMDKQIKTFKGSEVELEYLLTGENNAEVIMFVHGAGMNLRQFCVQHEYFSSQYKVLSVSLRGHGLSGHPKVKSGEYYTLEKNKDDLLELLEFLNINKVHFVGNSAGGVIGFYLVEARPDLFSSIVTYGTVGELKYSTLLTGIISGIDKTMLRWSPRRYLDFMSKNTSKYQSVQKEIFDMFMMSIEAVPYFRTNLGNYSCLNTIKNMTIPYLLIRGEQDKEINRSLTSTLEAIGTNSRATVVELAQAGHIANLDRPDEFNKILEEFWNQRVY
jgi:3-oxoadipate enol-lactonase